MSRRCRLRFHSGLEIGRKCTVIRFPQTGSKNSRIQPVLSPVFEHTLRSLVLTFFFIFEILIHPVMLSNAIGRT